MEESTEGREHAQSKKDCQSKKHYCIEPYPNCVHPYKPLSFEFIFGTVSPHESHLSYARHKSFIAFFEGYFDQNLADGLAQCYWLGRYVESFGSKLTC